MMAQALAAVLAEFEGFFFRGAKANYDAAVTHKDKLYFATDTGEILMNGKAYVGGGVKDVAIATGTLEGQTVLRLTMQDGTTKDMGLEAALLESGLLQYKNTISSDIAMVDGVGGIPAGTTAGDLKGKTFSQGNHRRERPHRRKFQHVFQQGTDKDRQHQAGRPRGRAQCGKLIHLHQRRYVRQGISHRNTRRQHHLQVPCGVCTRPTAKGQQGKQLRQSASRRHGRQCGGHRQRRISLLRQQGRHQHVRQVAAPDKQRHIGAGTSRRSRRQEACVQTSRQVHPYQSGTAQHPFGQLRGICHQQLHPYHRKHTGAGQAGAVCRLHAQ